MVKQWLRKEGATLECGEGSTEERDGTARVKPGVSRTAFVGVIMLAVRAAAISK